MSLTMITPQQILNDRKARKEAGLVGCITGRPAPEHIFDFFGMRDVQIWYKDASGRLNGDEGFDPMDPACFCFDCRGSFDSKGEKDAILFNKGHPRAVETYRNLLPLAIPDTRQGSEIYNGLRVNIPDPSYESFDEIPMSLPEPRRRDIAKETFEDRMYTDLQILRGQIQSEIVVAMDRGRLSECYQGAERAAFLEAVRKLEVNLLKVKEAVDIVLEYFE